MLCLGYSYFKDNKQLNKISKGEKPIHTSFDSAVEELVAKKRANQFKFTGEGSGENEKKDQMTRLRDQAGMNTSATELLI